MGVCRRHDLCGERCDVVLAPVVGGGVVGVRQIVGIDVDECRDRERELMVERVLDILGGVVAFPDRQVGVDGDRCGDSELVAVPSDSKIGDITHTSHFADGGLHIVDDLGLDSVEDAT